MILPLCAALLSTTGTASAQHALGANFNEHFEDIAYPELQRADDSWVRLFLAMPQVDAGPPAAHGAIRAARDGVDHGYKVIFTLKWPYHHKPFPSPGSAEMAQELARLDAVLPLVMGKVDILEIGNEPYIESRPQDQNASLNTFYELMAARAMAYRAAHCPGACKTRFYMGSLTRLELKGSQTASTQRWMDFVKATPGIDGVDIHPHVTALEESKPFLDYALPRMRPDQRFIATEFSLVWWWKQHMKEAIPASFAATYHLPPTMQNWQLIKAALDAPFTQAEWDDFLKQSPWFESRKHYLRHQMAMFRATGRLAVATYGFKQGSSMTVNFGPDSTPWLLNSVVAGRTVRPEPDGKAAFNYAWIDDFKALQQP
jgi:hypothetical protein